MKKVSQLLQRQLLLVSVADSDNMCKAMCVLSSAPSAPPSSVNAMVENSTSVTVQWGEVPCIDQNGAITGYSVQYGVEGSGNTENMTVSGASTTQTTISGLNPSTTYSIQVAAVNSAGTGVYSDPEMAETLPSEADN